MSEEEVRAMQHMKEGLSLLENFFIKKIDDRIEEIKKQTGESAEEQAKCH